MIKMVKRDRDLKKGKFSLFSPDLDPSAMN